MNGSRHDMCRGGSPDDVFNVLEARGREIVGRLGARWASEWHACDPAAETTQDAFAQSRSYQALLVGHVDFARRPCRPEHQPALLRGHVELILAVLRLMDDLASETAQR